MVASQVGSLHVFLGLDIIGPDGKSKKQITLNNIKSSVFRAGADVFNLDVVHSKELTLKDLQKIFLQLPVNSQNRIIVVKDSKHLKPELKDFISAEVASGLKNGLILILDVNESNPKDDFLAKIMSRARVWRFRQEIQTNTFTLTRQIEAKKSALALKILNQLLKDGEKPERILGGLRYAWMNDLINPLEKKKRLKMLLDCDLEIKTGRVKGDFALERLVVRLCASR